MPSHFDGLGVRVMYPDNWKIEDESESSVTLESPGGAFLTISKHDASVSIDDAMQQASEAMSAEYDIVEQEDLSEEIAGASVPIRVQRFVYLDLIIVARFYGITHDGDSYLLQVQGVDADVDELLPVFHAMITSLCQSLVPSE
ncbi:MAG: hypothetical protein Aurels2KO_21400 [Aureliella sp.]